MKWIKASYRFPNDPEDVILRSINNPRLIYTDVDSFEDEYMVIDDTRIYYSDIEWLDEESQENQFDLFREMLEYYGELELDDDASFEYNVEMLMKRYKINNT